MLESLDNANAKDKVTVTIEETRTDLAYADWSNRTVPKAPQPFLTQAYDASGKQVGFNKGTPNSGTIGYDPTLMLQVEHSDGTTTDFLPSVVLYHEMAHVDDYTHGTLRADTYSGTDIVDTGGNELERVATGLAIDHDDDPTTPEKTDDAFHPIDLTENALRDEMNLRRRQHYLVSRVIRS